VTLSPIRYWISGIGAIVELIRRLVTLESADSIKLESLAKDGIVRGLMAL
jgi:hypothetical protein